METLKQLRPYEYENIYKYTDRVEDKKRDITKIIQNKIQNEANIMIVTNHTIEMVDVILESFSTEEIAYIFMQSEIDTDPIKNPMVPLHRLARPEELKWLDEKNIPYECLPVLRMTDPIRRWHNFNLKSIIAIDRPGNRPYFRRVEV